MRMWPQYVAQGGLPRVLGGREGVPLSSQFPFVGCGSRSIDCHCAVLSHIVSAQPALKDDLRLRVRQRGQGCEDGYEPKR
jgi:hypothetical protein